MSARWAARYALEEEANVTLDDAQLVLTGLAGLRQEDPQASALALIAVFAARKRPDLERPFRRLLKTGLTGLGGALLKYDDM